MLRNVMNAVAHFSSGIRNVLRAQSLIDRFPRHASVVTAKRTRGRDSDIDPFTIGRVENDCVQTQTARGRLPLRSGAVTAQTRKLLPRLTAVRRLEQSGIFNTG